MSTLTATPPAPAKTEPAVEHWDRRNAVMNPDGSRVNELNDLKAVINSRLDRAAEQALFEKQNKAIEGALQENSTELRLGKDGTVTHVSDVHAGGNFSGSEMKNVVFTNTSVRGGVYYSCVLDNVKYGRGCDGEGASFIECVITNGSDLSGLQRVRSLRDSIFSTDSKIGAINMNGGDLRGLSFYRPETGETLRAGEYFAQLVQEGGEKYALREFKKMFNGMRFNAATLMDEDLRAILIKVSRSVADLNETSLATKEGLFNELMANPHFANNGELQSAKLITPAKGEKNGRNAIEITLKDKEDPANSVTIAVDAEETKKGDRFRVSYSINGELLTSEYLERRGIPPLSPNTVTGPEAFSQVLSAVRDFERQFKQAELKGSRQVPLDETPGSVELARHSQTREVIATNVRSDIAGYNAAAAENAQIPPKAVDTVVDRYTKLVNIKTGEFDDVQAAAYDRYLERNSSIPSKDDSRDRIPLSEDQRKFLREQLAGVRKTFEPYEPGEGAEIDYEAFAGKIMDILTAYHRAQKISPDGEQLVNEKMETIVRADPDKKLDTINAVVRDLKGLRSTGDAGLREKGLSDGSTAIIIDRLADLTKAVADRMSTSEESGAREVEAPEEDQSAQDASAPTASPVAADPVAAPAEVEQSASSELAEAPEGKDEEGSALKADPAASSPTPSPAAADPAATPAEVEQSASSEPAEAPGAAEAPGPEEEEVVVIEEDGGDPHAATPEKDEEVARAAEGVAIALAADLATQEQANTKLFSDYTEEVRGRSERAAALLDRIKKQNAIYFEDGSVIDPSGVQSMIETERQAVMQAEADAIQLAGSSGALADTEQYEADKAALEEIRRKLLGAPNMFGTPAKE